MNGSVLAGRTGVFLWNWSALGDDPELTVSQFLERTGVSFVLLKAWDGSAWFDQGLPWREAAARLRAAGVSVVGAWGYQLLAEPVREAELAAECVTYGNADLVVLNCEDPVVERSVDPAMAAGAFWRRYGELAPGVETWFCSHAQPAYHQRQPYYQALIAGAGMMPMAYHGAMGMAPAESIAVARSGYGTYWLTINGMCYAGDAYTTGDAGVTPGSLVEWAAAAINEGSEGLVWWSMDELLRRPELQDAIATVRFPPS